MHPNRPYDYTRDTILATHGYTEKAFHNNFHLHSRYEIYFFIQGNVNYFVEQSCYRLQKGNLLIFNSHEIHRAVNLTDSPYERITIHFEPQLIRQFCTKQTNLLSCFENRETGTNNITLLDPSKLNNFMSTALQLIHSMDSHSFGSDLLPLSYLIQLLVMVNETFSEKEPRMTSILSSKIIPILQYIDSHITENLSLDNLSKILSIDKYYLSHLFKQNTGITLYQYILMKRILLAKHLLLEGVSVTETCQQSGFNDYSNFIRTFKKVTGVSPGNFGNHF
jgi:YesN/AraC family two-component response regulator